MNEASLASDEELISAIRRDESPEALEALVHRHLPQVRSVVSQMVLSDAATDDITQEVFLRALRGLSGFDGRARFSTWLFRIARNTTHTYLQRQSRTPSPCQLEAAECVAVGSTPDHRLLTHELYADIKQALGELTPALRAAIVLTALQGISPAEAAKIEDCSTSTMYWRIHEARKQLRERLQEHLT